MKKNLLLRLCLILMVAVTAYSCRTDQFPEQETYNNSSKFQLTSRRISLDEARHKLKLISEIEKVEAGMKAKTKTNAQGRTVNYGNGVSIDTDDVIYLEGPDLHSYTFRINYENAPADAPVENLVISSRPDGTWKEVLVTYYLTPQEKQNMLSGVAVDFTGKVTHEVLQNGTYSSAMMQGMQNCYWEVSSYYTRCGGRDDHHNGELPVSEGGPCETDTPSVLVVTLVEKCTIALPADTNLGENGEGGGGGPQNGPGGLSGGNEPDETVTAPNFPSLKATSCQRLNALIKNNTFKNNAGNLFDNVGLNSETGYTMGTPIPGQTTSPNQYLESPQGSTSVNFIFHYNIYAFMHTHFENSERRMYPIFSPEDIINFNKWIAWAKAWNAIPANADKQVNIRNLTYTVVTSQGNYTLMFDGTDVVPFPNYTEMEIEKLNRTYRTELDKARNPNNDFETLFLKFLRKDMNINTHIPGLKVFRINKDDDTATEIKLDGNIKQTIQCP